tara:strand:+ start:399 stop:1061 length:663 start_codon:yes stop_codon:yes gene_type:complete
MGRVIPEAIDSYVNPVIEFLKCRTPERWVSKVIESNAMLESILMDHVSLELRAAEQAQKLIRRYGSTKHSWGIKLISQMSRLAREELRHFEKTLDIITKRGMVYRPISASHYASTLHAAINKQEPQRLIDTLIVGAIIEARSCERFYSLSEAMVNSYPDLSQFYQSLLKSEGRHFHNYLKLAEIVNTSSILKRTESFLNLDKQLITKKDPLIRFHSGIPV